MFILCCLWQSLYKVCFDSLPWLNTTCKMCSVTAVRYSREFEIWEWGIGKSGWRSGHQSRLLPLLQMLYVDWVSVDLNLTSKVSSGHTGFLPPQKLTHKNRTPFKLALLNWTFLYKYWPLMATKTSTSFVRERSGTLFSPSSSLARNLFLLIEKTRKTGSRSSPPGFLRAFKGKIRVTTARMLYEDDTLDGDLLMTFYESEVHNSPL